MDYNGEIVARIPQIIDGENNEELSLDENDVFAKRGKLN